MAVTVNCMYCKKDFEVYNYRKYTAKFCSQSCSIKYLFKTKVLNPRFKKGNKSWNEGNQNGKSIGSFRIYARKKLGIKKWSGLVVHHSDGNPENNDTNNLVVFNSQSEHAKFHYEKGDLNLIGVKNGCR